MKKKESIVRNADNETSMPWGNEVFTVGFVPEVNGSEAAEVPGFVPTRHELIKLTEYWEGVAIDRLWYYFLTGQVGSSDRRLREFALCRIDRIWALIGEEDVSQAIERAYATRQQDGRDPRLWDVFLNGDSEEARVAVLKEVFGEMEKDVPAQAPPTETSSEGTDES